MLSNFFYRSLLVFLCLLLISQVAVLRCPAQALFGSNEVLPLTISGNVKVLMKDRDKESKYHPFKLSYATSATRTDTIAVNIKTRGHFRKMSSNCTYPPLMLNFSKSAKTNTGIFHGNEKLKLVMPCRDDDYVIREWLLYQLYQLMTPQSFKARLVKVTLDNDGSRKQEKPFFGIILEDENQMAKRNNAVITKRKTTPAQTDSSSFFRMAVFQYLICNTDWSIQYLQNIKLILPKNSGVPVAVPYDFDHAGLVDAPYAMPAEELHLSSIKERRYRGYCIQDMSAFNEVFKLYNKKKNEIYQLFASCEWLEERHKKTIASSLDEFYEVINNAEKAQKDFKYPCDKYGTGNVVIKGLRED